MKTTDLCDAHSDKIQVAEPSGFRDFGGRTSFHGQIVTVKCFEDNSFVRTALEQDGKGKVLVVDGGGSKRCALLGDLLGELAVKNNWQGIVIYGCIRDSAAMRHLPLGVKALDVIPLKSNKRHEGQQDIAVKFSGVLFAPGDYLYADEDGMITSAVNLLSEE